MGILSGRRLLLGAVIASSVGIGYAIGAQPHMAETITLLQTARAELVKATPNKGGHRERALGLIRPGDRRGSHRHGLRRQQLIASVHRRENAITRRARSARRCHVRIGHVRVQPQPSASPRQSDAQATR